jgi:deazaflavin-dependent oxidoreductase (nitroreductase family)
MTQATPDDPPGPAPAIWPKKRLQTSGGRRAGDAVVATLTRWGLVPHTYVMTTIGRKTGQPRSTPVTLVEKNDQRWLVAPYGPVPWVLNARAAGRVTISRRGHARDYAITEIDPKQAGPILKDYLKIAGATKTYFEATKNSPVADFTAEASRHPVFELTS